MEGFEAPCSPEHDEGLDGAGEEVVTTNFGAGVEEGRGGSMKLAWRPVLLCSNCLRVST
jgi:hypothetical protein